MKHNTKPNNMKDKQSETIQKINGNKKNVGLDCLSCALIVIFALGRSHFVLFCFVLFCFVFFWLAKQWVSLKLFTKRIGSTWISHFFLYLAIIGVRRGEYYWAWGE